MDFEVKKCPSEQTNPDRDIKPVNPEGNDLEVEFQTAMDAWRSKLPMREAVGEDGPGVFIVTARSMAQLYDLLNRFLIKAYKTGSEETAVILEKKLMAEFSKRASSQKGE